MAHLQYMPGDPRLVDQLVYELKSKGIFDQFRKDCISDVDTRPAYQNLRQRVESSVSLFLSRQAWKPDLNKNQLREKLRKHILDGNYLEQGVERIVDQVVNPKVASVFIPQVEDLVYNYLGIARKKSTPESSNDKGNASTDLLPTDLEAVSPGSVKSNDDKDELMEEPKDDNMEINTDDKPKDLNDISMPSEAELEKEDTQLSGISDLTSHDSETSLGKLSIPMPEAEEINLENIPSPENSPPKIDLDSIEMPKEEEPIELKDIPLPDESPKDEKEQYFKPVNSEDDSSSDSSIIRNMSPLTPIRNFNNENSCDAQQAFENDNDSKDEVKQEPNTFRFTIEAKSTENSCDDIKETKPEKEEQTDLSYQFSEQVNINAFNTPLYDDSSNSHNLQIDYESDVNSKTNLDKIPFPDDPNSEDSKKELTEEKKSHKSSHRSRDSQRHSSSSKDRKSDSKTYNSKDRRDSKTDRKTSKDDQSKSKSSSDKSKDRGDKKESKDGKDNKDSKHRSSSHKSSSSKDSKDSKHRSSSSSQKHSSKTDDKKSSNTTNKDKDKEKDKAADKSLKEHRSSKDSKSRSDKDKKTKKDDKDKKDKKDTDDHYTASGRGNHSRRSTDRDSNDGSSSSKGSQNPSSSKSSESKANKGTSSKSDNTSPSSDATSPSDKGTVTENNTEANMSQSKPVVRVDTHLERPVGTPPRLPFVPDVTLKKPKFAANLAEAKRLMKMRKFLDEEQKRMNQEAALLLEFQANVRPSLSQVYSSIPGPELEFACISNIVEPAKPILETNYAEVQPIEEIGDVPDSIEMELSEMNRETKEIVPTEVPEAIIYEPIEYTADFEDSEKILNEISKKVYGVTDESIEEDYEAEMTEDIISETIKKNEDTEFEVIVITEEMIDNEAVKETVEPKYEIDETVQNNERPLEYFAESEKFDAELERAKFENFLKEYLTTTITDKLYLINCNSYEENIMKEVAETFGHFEIINYHKNGFKNKNVVKNVNVSNEIVLPLDRNSPVEVNVLKSTQISPIFSPVKSECSFELSSDYDARLEEMVNKTSRQEIMEIILGGSVPDESPSKMPKIDYCMDDHFERDEDLKRKMSVESLDNNNEHVLTPNKMRKLSDSDQISSTTEETPVNVNLSKTNSVRSKYLGKARRVGLSRPRRTVQPNSPSSDKSVENYDTSGSPAPNGKLKSQRKVQRYDTSDLYKPKLHYLSRRNNIS